MECLGNTWQKISRRERHTTHLHSYRYKAQRDRMEGHPAEVSRIWGCMGTHREG